MVQKVVKKVPKVVHRKAECRSKAKTESTPSHRTKYVKQAQPQSDADKHVSFYSAFGSMPDDGNKNCDDLIRQCNLVLKVPELTGDQVPARPVYGPR
jgi:hypothetical protein